MTAEFVTTLSWPIGRTDVRIFDSSEFMRLRIEVTRLGKTAWQLALWNVSLSQSEQLVVHEGDILRHWGDWRDEAQFSALAMIHKAHPNRPVTTPVVKLPEYVSKAMLRVYVDGAGGGASLQGGGGGGGSGMVKLVEKTPELMHGKRMEGSNSWAMFIGDRKLNWCVTPRHIVMTGDLLDLTLPDGSKKSFSVIDVNTMRELPAGAPIKKWWNNVFNNGDPVPGDGVTLNATTDAWDDFGPDAALTVANGGTDCTPQPEEKPQHVADDFTAIAKRMHEIQRAREEAWEEPPRDASSIGPRAVDIGPTKDPLARMPAMSLMPSHKLGLESL